MFLNNLLQLLLPSLPSIFVKEGLRKVWERARTAAWLVRWVQQIASIVLIDFTKHVFIRLSTDGDRGARFWSVFLCFGQHQVRLIEWRLIRGNNKLPHVLVFTLLQLFLNSRKVVARVWRDRVHACILIIARLFYYRAYSVRDPNLRLLWFESGLA